MSVPRSRPKVNINSRTAHSLTNSFNPFPVDTRLGLPVLTQTLNKTKGVFSIPCGARGDRFVLWVKSPSLVAGGEVGCGGKPRWRSYKAQTVLPWLLTVISHIQLSPLSLSVFLCHVVLNGV